MSLLSRRRRLVVGETGFVEWSTGVGGMMAMVMFGPDADVSGRGWGKLTSVVMCGCSFIHYQCKKGWICFVTCGSTKSVSEGCKHPLMVISTSRTYILLLENDHGSDCHVLKSRCSVDAGSGAPI